MDGSADKLSSHNYVIEIKGSDVASSTLIDPLYFDAQYTHMQLWAVLNHPGNYPKNRAHEFLIANICRLSDSYLMVANF